MEQSESDPRIGQLIGNYIVRSRLGKGGMGSVYVGEHPEIKRRVAIKVLHPSLTQQPDFATRFIDEARIIAQLDHPNVVDIYDFGRTTDGSLYYIMELLQGVDLDEVLMENMQLSAVEVLPYLTQICAALDAAHDAGVVHRDLKLENIYVLDRDPLLVKLLDFGISKIMDVQKPAHSKTGTGVVIGTPTFMAPEQAAGKQELIGPQTDLYAVGVVLFHLLTGRAPFAADTAPELMVMHMNAPPPSLSSINPDLPGSIDRLLKICLAKDPKQRPPSAGWIAEAYAEALELDPATTGVAAAPRLPTGKATGRRASSVKQVSTSTLSGSAAQMSAITLPRSPIWRRMALVVSFVAVGLTVFLVLRWIGARNPDPHRTAATQKVAAPKARLDQQVPVKPDPPRPKPSAQPLVEKKRAADGAAGASDQDAGASAVAAGADAGAEPEVVEAPKASKASKAAARRRRSRRSRRSRRRARKAKTKRAKAAEPASVAAPKTKKPATKKPPKRVGAGTLDF
jgi:serine/threonine protein kinase